MADSSDLAARSLEHPGYQGTFVYSQGTLEESERLAMGNVRFLCFALPRNAYNIKKSALNADQRRVLIYRVDQQKPAERSITKITFSFERYHLVNQNRPKRVLNLYSH